MATTRSRPSHGRERAHNRAGGAAAEHRAKIYAVALVGAAVILAFLTFTSTGHVVDAAVQHFMLFYAGVFALIALCASVGLGFVAGMRIVLSPGHRIFVQSAHRAASFGALAFLAIHITTEILAQRSHALDAFIPFLSPFRTFYIGLGTLASDLIILLVITGIFRKRFTVNGKAWRWRAIHYSSYACLVFGVLHGLLGGRAAAPYVDWSYGFVVALVALGLAVRAITGSMRAKETLSAPPVPESGVNAGSAPMRAAAMFAQLGIARAVVSGGPAVGAGPMPAVGAGRAALPGGAAWPEGGAWLDGRASADMPAVAALAAPVLADIISTGSLAIPVNPAQPGGPHSGAQPVYEPGYVGPPRYRGAPRNPWSGPLPQVTTGAMPALPSSEPPRARTGPMPRAGTGPMPAAFDGQWPRSANGPMPRAATGPMPRPATGPMPVVPGGQLPRAATGPVPRVATGPMPRAATGPMPRAATGAMPVVPGGQLPRAATGPVPRAATGPMPRAATGPMPTIGEGAMPPGGIGPVPPSWLSSVPGDPSASSFAAPGPGTWPGPVSRPAAMPAASAMYPAGAMPPAGVPRPGPVPSTGMMPPGGVGPYPRAWAGSGSREQAMPGTAPTGSMAPVAPSSTGSIPAGPLAGGSWPPGMVPGGLSRPAPAGHMPYPSGRAAEDGGPGGRARPRATGSPPRAASAPAGPERPGSWPTAGDRPDSGAWATAGDPRSAGPWPAAGDPRNSGSWPAVGPQDSGSWPAAGRAPGRQQAGSPAPGYGGPAHRPLATNVPAYEDSPSNPAYDVRGYGDLAYGNVADAGAGRGGAAPAGSWDHGIPGADPRLRYRSPGPGMPGYQGGTPSRGADPYAPGLDATAGYDAASLGNHAASLGYEAGALGRDGQDPYARDPYGDGVYGREGWR
ncbi:MAG TPA: hypothetical protein VH478_04055 [Trebonia sp.]|nr:hypothetical protein [Trebonia sp.]